MSIKENWREYRTEHVPENASMIQILETRQAFYAGIGEFITELMGNGNGNSSPESVEAIMDKTIAELKEYMNEPKK